MQNFYQQKAYKTKLNFKLYYKISKYNISKKIMKKYIKPNIIPPNGKITPLSGIKTNIE